MNQLNGNATLLEKNDYRKNDYSIIFFEEKEQFHHYNTKKFNKIVYDEVMEQALKSSITLGSEQIMKETIDTIFKYLMDNRTPILDCQLFFSQMLTTIFMAAKITNTDLYNIFNTNYNSLHNELNEFHELNQVKSWFKYISNKIVSYTNKSDQDSSMFLVEKAKYFINKYYFDSNISIKSVCDYLHISTSYFSFIFKRETKMTFLNYLTQIRMRNSEELLRTTDMKAIAIANEVGYSEPKYFSYCFKKYHGISPSEYRNTVNVG